jgi:Spy/CpxP family protein refolding chaperone
MLGLAFAPGWGQEGAAKPEKPKPEVKKRAPKKPGLRGMHVQMAKVCGLSQEQTDKIIAANKLRREAMKAFNDANGAKIKALQKELNDLYAKRKKIEADGLAEIMAVLTDEQNATWNQWQAIRVMQMKFARARLTQDQLETIKAEYVRAAVGVDLSNAKDRQNLTKKLYMHVHNEVLTDAQRLELSKPKEPGKPVKKKPGAAKPKAKPAVEK